MADQDLVFTKEDRPALKSLLMPAKAKSKFIYIALDHDPSDLDDATGSDNQVQDLFTDLLIKIINKKTSKTDLVAALKSKPVGHGQLGNNLELDRNIDGGMLKMGDFKKISKLLLPAAAQYRDLAWQLGENPDLLGTAKKDQLDIMLDKLLNEKGVTQNQLAEALRDPLVGHGQLADKLLQHDFGGATTQTPAVSGQDPAVNVTGETAVAPTSQTGSMANTANVPSTTPSGQSGGALNATTCTTGTTTGSGQGNTTSTGAMTGSGQGNATTIGNTTGSGQGNSQGTTMAGNKFCSNPDHKAKRLVCNETFTKLLEEYLVPSGRTLVGIKEKYMDKAFKHAKYDYSDVEVDCSSIIESDPIDERVGNPVTHNNNEEESRDKCFSLTFEYTEGLELMKTVSSGWNISGGLSAEYQGIGASTGIGYTEQQSESVKRIRGKKVSQQMTETFPVKAKHSRRATATQRFQKKECQVRNIKLSFPKNAKIKCNFHDTRDTDPNKVRKSPLFPIKDILKDYIKDGDTDTLTATLEGKYVWVEINFIVNAEDPIPL